MKRGWLLWLLTLALAAGVGAWLGVRESPEIRDPDEPLAMVGSRVVRERQGRALLTRQLPLLLGEVLTNRVIMQTTINKGMSINASKELVWPAYLRDAQDWNAFGPRLWATRALQKLALQDWPEERQREFHRIFEEELRQYELRGLEMVRAEDLSYLKSDLADGRDFEDLLANYGVDAQGERHQLRGLFSRSELEEDYGTELTTVLANLKPGAFTPILRKGSRYVLFQLVRRKTSFEELKPEIQSRILESRRMALIYQLFQTPELALRLDSPVEYHWIDWK